LIGSYSLPTAEVEYLAPVAASFPCFDTFVDPLAYRYQVITAACCIPSLADTIVEEVPSPSY
jgi:hypothetical protein